MNLEDKRRVHKRAEEISSRQFCGESTKASLIKSGRMAGLSNLHNKYGNTGDSVGLSMLAAFIGYAGCILTLAIKAPRMSDEEALLIKTCLAEDLHIRVKSNPTSMPAGAF